MISIKLTLTILVLVLGFRLHVANAELRLELVQVLFRHGERTPREKELWPTSVHNLSTYEPWGLGQMTNEGKMREYRIGKMLRERYNEFLGNIYHPSDVYAVSTDLDRTKMSLQLVLAGLYHPAPTQSWNAELSWMPIPIHYMPEKVDTLMKPDFSPVYLEAMKQVRDSEEILNKVSIHRNLFKSLSEETGIDITRTDQVYEMYNSLVAQESLKLTLPEWCTDQVYEQLQEIVKLEYEIRSYTPLMKRLNGGTLVKRFIENMKRNEQHVRRRKIYLYSGHEVNIAGFVRAHNFIEPELPSYGCAIIVEKLSDEAGKKFIKMLLWTGITEELIPYKFVDSDEICPIDKYLDTVKEAIPSEEECNHKWDYISKEELQRLYEERLNNN